jgi:hypothetical protein
VGDLQADGAAHGVPDQDGLVDVEPVEDGDRALGQPRDVEDARTALAAAVAGQVRDHVDPAGGQGTGGRHQVGAGDREAVQVDERDTVLVRAAPEVDRRPSDLELLVHPAVAWSGVGPHGQRLGEDGPAWR